MQVGKEELYWLSTPSEARIGLVASIEKYTEEEAATWLAEHMPEAAKIMAVAIASHNKLV